ENTARAQSPIIYLPDTIRDDPDHRERHPALVRQLSTMRMQQFSNKTIELYLKLGPVIPYYNHPLAPNAAPEAEMKFKGPILLSCSLIQGGQMISDPNWESPFCARVKAEMNLSQYLD